MAEEPKQNIWDFALATSKDLQGIREKNKSLVFVGSKSGSKDVVNLWELGGGTFLTNLLDFVITPSLIPELGVVLIADLSKPEELISTVETLLENIRERVDSLVASEKSYLVKESLRQKSRSRIGEKHEDISDVNPSLLPIIIVGTKYDIFQSFDAEKKKAVNRYLRLTAHVNGAALLYTSIRTEVTMSRMKTLLSSFSNLSTDSLEAVFDYNKPLLIPFGSDSFQLIGFISLDAVKKDLTDLFPQNQETAKFVIPDNPGADPKFKEKDVDLVRAIRDQELEEYRRQVEASFSSFNLKSPIS